MRFNRCIVESFVLAAFLSIGLWLVHGQFRPDRGRSPGSGRNSGARFMRDRDPASRGGVPEWKINERFKSDIFTFVRLRYQSSGRRGGGWAGDFPNADLNFSYRLEQLTSMRVNPDGLVLDIDDPALFNYPFTFVMDPRSIVISDNEAEILRRYLLNGGFMMVDDFWGNEMWNHLTRELKKVFPDREPESLSLDHSIFKMPFPLKEKPQVPSEDSAHRTRDHTGPSRTWEDEISWEEPQPADYRAIFDDRGRIMVLICWNTDLSDGWEEEGVDEWFFTNFSERYSYPMGINIVVYALTH